MKKEYTPAELEIILFNQDVITSSPGDVLDPEDSEGNGIGDKHNPGGWI